MILALALATAFDFYSFGPYDAHVSRPEAVLGYGPGERNSTYYDQERVLEAITSAAKDRVVRIDYGKSTEGRPLRVLVFSSLQNIKNLDHIKAVNQAIADGKVDQKDVPADQPVVVWVNECIHGNETASFESGMWLAYTLAASRNREITSLLDHAVVVLNPSYNPDGHERFVVWYDSIARGDADRGAVEHRESGINNGRTNHYRFDLNRDRVALSQAESQQAVAMFRQWNPQVYVDQHGEVGTYFFPPVAQSINKDIGRDRYIEFSNLLGKETAHDFDQHGWRYYVRETFDLYYAGYLDSWSSLNGAIGMTHETDGGGSLRTERRDGSVVTLLDGMEKHFTSALAVLRGAVQNRPKFLQSFAKFKHGAVQGKDLGDIKRIIVEGDGRATSRYENLLQRQGIAYTVVTGAFTQTATSFFGGGPKSVKVPVGSVVVDLAQPRGALAKSLLSPGQDFEKEFTDRQLAIRDALRADDQYPFRDRPEFYDTTGWSVPLAFGLDAYVSSETPEIKPAPLPMRPIVIKGGKVGWVVPYTDQEDALAAIELLQSGVRMSVATKEMTVDGQTLSPGTFFIFRDRNVDPVDEKVTAILGRHGSIPIPLETSFPDTGVVGPGSDSVDSLDKPEIAIVFGDQPNGTRFGSAWFVFEKVFKLPFTAVSQRALSGDLDKYTAIVLPGGARATPELKAWVQSGGTLISLGNGAVINKDWVDLEQSKLEDKKDPTDLPGAIFQAEFNPLSPLSYGYDASKPIGVPLSGSTFYRQRKEGGGALLLEGDPNALSGWTWPDEGDALKGTVWLHDQTMGRGHVVWFVEDPTSRAMWPSTYKMLLNAVLLGRTKR